MEFNTHYKLTGAHAFLSASKFHWIRYDEEKLERLFAMHMAAKRGSDLHDLARDLIKLGVKLDPNIKTTLNMYVNDAIGFKMRPEQVLYYSVNCYGTTDAIGFRNNKLRIFDLKTGVNQSSVDQLMVYAALFCLEYGYEPFDIEIEMRIYQNDEVKIFDPDLTEIKRISEQIKFFDKKLNALMEEAK
jgi:hypothetical protein